VPSELERLLGEVDSFIAVGFVEDAKEVLRDAATRFPSHPAISRKMDELQMDASAPEPSPESSPLEHLAAEEPTPEPASEGFDLGAELGELFQSQPAVEAPEEASAATSLGDPALEDIFKEFRKGVDKQLDTEDYDTRYNLGIAYKEMGLIDEAISEFQLAAKDPGRILECSSMLGICFLEKGMPKLAVKWFEKGLKAEGRTEEEYQGLRYDLAGALEAAGDVDQAIALYRELHTQNAGFRDVAAKLRELSAASG
jgi:tetratricopeptide (TPR) repeat protein